MGVQVGGATQPGLARSLPKASATVGRPARVWCSRRQRVGDLRRVAVLREPVQDGDPAWFLPQVGYGP